MAARIFRSVLAGTVILGLCGPVLAQDADEEPDPVVPGIALSDAPMTLPKGLAASEAHGKPISAKFENADGDVRLSVYTVKPDGFVETALNPKTGVIIASEPITDSNDLTRANGQKAAMEKATLSLQVAAEKAVHENPGSQAISIVAELRDGRPVAAVKLLRAKDIVTAAKPLV